jgi:ABC-type nitrate/sulfonate/bicarbonate transport system permease component
MAAIDRAPPELPALRLMRATLWLGARVISIVLLLAVWELVARSGAVTQFQLPALSKVLVRIWSDALSGELAINTAVTLYRAMAGFLIAAVGGVALGMAMSRLRVARWFFDPIISVGFPMPKIAFLPVIILWLGVFDVSKITMIVFDAIFPVIAATLIGIQGVERELLWSARNMGANERETLWQIVLPAALPQIMTGLQVALPLSLIVAVVTEMLMGGYGLGGAMMTASRFANSVGVFAGIVEIAVVGYVLVKAMALIRRRLLIWHQEANDPTTRDREACQSRLDARHS